jgi:hypothetical protein
MPVTPLGGVTLAPIKDPAYADDYAQQIYDAIDEAQNETLVKTENQNFTDKELSRAKLKDTSEVVYNAGNISGAVSLDYTNGSYQYATLTGNVSSLTISNWPASGTGGFMTLELIQDGTGSRTLTLGSAYKTAGTSGVTLTTTASKRDKLYLQTRDAGTTIDVTPAYNWG